MRQLPKLYLLLSSISCLLITSCAISKYKPVYHCVAEPSSLLIAPVLPANKTIKFKTTIDILKNHLSGILVVKQTDSITTHIVFVTELGMKMFDFAATGDSIKALYVFEPLNKPAIINVLKQNFYNMLQFNLTNKVIVGCANKNNTEHVFILNNIKKQKTYLRALDSVKSNVNSNILYYPYLQETFNGKKRTSKINYEFIQGDAVNYYKITCKQYGIIKFYYELINISD